MNFRKLTEFYALSCLTHVRKCKNWFHFSDDTEMYVRHICHMQQNQPKLILLQISWCLFDFLRIEFRFGFINILIKLSVWLKFYPLNMELLIYWVGLTSAVVNLYAVIQNHIRINRCVIVTWMNKNLWFTEYDTHHTMWYSLNVFGNWCLHG